MHTRRWVNSDGVNEGNNKVGVMMRVASFIGLVLIVSIFALLTLYAFILGEIICKQVQDAFVCAIIKLTLVMISLAFIVSLIVLLIEEKRVYS